MNKKTALFDLLFLSTIKSNMSWEDDALELNNVALFADPLHCTSLSMARFR